MNPIFIYALHRNGAIDDSVGELMTAAKALDPKAKPTAIVCGSGFESAAASLRNQFACIWSIASENCTNTNAEAVRYALAKILPKDAIVLLAHEHFTMDLGPGLSIKLGAAYVPDVIGIEGAGKFVRQEFNGQFSARVECDLTGGAVITVRPGAFKPAMPEAANGEVIDKTAEVGAIAVGRRYVETIPAQVGDVDITKQTVLVSVGRGLQDAENLPIAEELARALGAAVSCSRPVVDAKWLDKSRQVGSSGATVSPKVYLACGISGSFQHMAGIKGSPYLVAINKNPAAPIFQFADVGIVDDLLEFLPALTERVKEVTAHKGAKMPAMVAH
jgi:electron transfer flavoprotein alpha subunit